MQFTSIFAATLFAAAVSAAPTKRDGQWTFQSFTRICNSDDTSCDVSFGINTNDGSAVTDCKYTVTGSPASRQTVVNAACGDFLVGSTWSNQFGDDKAYTTWSVHNSNTISFPAYADSLFSTGNTISPDQSFATQPFSG